MRATSHKKTTAILGSFITNKLLSAAITATSLFALSLLFFYQTGYEWNDYNSTNPTVNNLMLVSVENIKYILVYVFKFELSPKGDFDMHKYGEEN